MKISDILALPLYLFMSRRNGWVFGEGPREEGMEGMGDSYRGRKEGRRRARFRGRASSFGTTAPASLYAFSKFPAQAGWGMLELSELPI